MDNPFFSFAPILCYAGTHGSAGQAEERALQTVKKSNPGAIGLGQGTPCPCEPVFMFFANPKRDFLTNKSARLFRRAPGDIGGAETASVQGAAVGTILSPYPRRR